MMTVDELTIQDQLEEKRMEEQTAAAAETAAAAPTIKRMSLGMFAIGILLLLAQTAIAYLTGGTIGFLLGAPISLILWLMVRPYRKSLGQLSWFLNGSFLVDAIPFIDLVPADLILWVVAFFVSRKETI